jgi:hypothetical protein
MYDSCGKFLEETFEVESCSVGAVLDVLEDPEDKLEFGVKTESTGGHHEISDISPSLPGVSVEAKEGMEFRDVFRGEDGVFISNVFCEDCFELFLLDFFPGHDRS